MANPYVDGHAAERIMGILLREYDSYSELEQGLIIELRTVEDLIKVE